MPRNKVITETHRIPKCSRNVFKKYFNNYTIYECKRKNLQRSSFSLLTKKTFSEKSKKMSHLLYSVKTSQMENRIYQFTAPRSLQAFKYARVFPTNGYRSCSCIFKKIHSVNLQMNSVADLRLGQRLCQ